MKLTSDQQKAIARKANWYFDCYFGMNHEDSVVFTGDGVDDLDSLLVRLNFAINHQGIGVNSRFLAEVGGVYSDWRPFDVEDVQVLRAHYGQNSAM